ncbi:GNAT family N-acetyltransferase [Paenibacillus mendelii]|uniref:GNAT family N-acetyltransferase n=1 Tax=Paenibacillus mendelii TaxID=206163 RepID=A0ABV6J3E5_9BACL|nr:GNAT family N-acetyltransferase [Paenibacillus mendelii]MCQ6560546.1 GNAT family N-acetyltransferase [Paenibacillus mendelii]
MSHAYEPVRLAEADKRSFVSLISRAFAGDPLFLHVFGDSERDGIAASRVKTFASFMFDKSFLLEEEIRGVFENDRLLGAYIVEKPRTPSLRLRVRECSLVRLLIRLWRQTSGRTVIRLNGYMKATRDAAPPWPHHYLIMIGVDPETQGRGIGRLLLDHLLKSTHEDRRSRGVALDTENVRNVAFYQKFGFVLGSETKSGDLRVFCMHYYIK